MQRDTTSTRRRSGRRDHATGRGVARIGLGAGILATIGGVVLVATAPLVSGQVAGRTAPVRAAAAKGTGNIAVTQTPIASGSPCTSAATSLSYTVFSDASIFRLRVVASAPLCPPVTATAVIYAMPGGGEAWPQELVETKSFTISGAGVTDIVFTKDCTPAQFDVVTGATPQTISPLGEKHGPLLFPTDVDTAYQDPGAVCAPATSTTSPNGVTSTTLAATTTTVANNGVVNTTTTTAAVGVFGTTTIASKGSDPVRVLDTTEGPNSPASLAVTGVSSADTATLGGVLFVVGVVLIVSTRRRALPAVRMITSNSSVNPNSPFSVD